MGDVIGDILALLKMGQDFFGWVTRCDGFNSDGLHDGMDFILTGFKMG